MSHHVRVVTCRPYISRQRRSGLTLSEIVMSLGILALAALVIVGVFLALIKSSAKNREQVMAELLSQSVLDRAASEGPSGWGVKRQIGERLEAELENDGSRFFYQVDPVRIEAATADPAGQSWEVTVTVGWWTTGSRGLEQSRVGFGNQYVKAVRSVYHRSDRST